MNQDKKHFIDGIEGAAYQTTDDSVFSVDEWAVYDWAMMLKNYPHLDGLVDAANKVGIDAREGFFALSGFDLKNPLDPRSTMWQSLLDTPVWKKAQNQASSQFEKAALLTGLLQKMGRKALTLDAKNIEQTEESVDLENMETITLDDLLMKERNPDIPDDESVDDSQTFLLLAKMMADYHGESSETLDETLEMALQLDMKTLKDLFGFTARIVKGASRKAKGTQGNMVGYTMSPWSDRVIVQDMIGVANGDLQALVKLAESGLSARDYDTEVPQGKGSVIFLRDETASMAPYAGLPGLHRPAQSLEVALAHAFNKDKRDLVCIPWGGKSTGGSITRTHTWGDGDTVQHLKKFFKTGYTYLYEALVEALNTADSYVPGSDIVIASDGFLQDSARLMSDTTLRKKLEKFWNDGGRIFVIVLGSLDKEKWYNSFPVVDGIIQLDDIKSGDALEKLISAIADRTPEGAKRTLV